ncbi:MAG: hypothetical protein M1815_001149 [Lichina confinis]|nr:MAG: hypothetical protein M1815_001149 [Lichina confinis]
MLTADDVAPTADTTDITAVAVVPAAALTRHLTSPPGVFPHWTHERSEQNAGQSLAGVSDLLHRHPLRYDHTSTTTTATTTTTAAAAATTSTARTTCQQASDLVITATFGRSSPAPHRLRAWNPPRDSFEPRTLCLAPSASERDSSVARSTTVDHRPASDNRIETIGQFSDDSSHPPAHRTLTLLCVGASDDEASSVKGANAYDLDHDHLWPTSTSSNITSPHRRRTEWYKKRIDSSDRPPPPFPALPPLELGSSAVGWRRFGRSGSAVLTFASPQCPYSLELSSARFSFLPATNPSTESADKFVPP